MLKSKMAADIRASVGDEWLVREGCGPTRGTGDAGLMFDIAPVRCLSRLANCN
jgi:hypothetical protein